MKRYTSEGAAKTKSEISVARTAFGGQTGARRYSGRLVPTMPIPMPRLRRISRIARPILGHAIRAVAAISFGFDWLRLMSRATRVYKLLLARL
ncbi:hypothetical protein ALC60_00248 [Trachymyrmex zeteki]|uniref:Uncharacterized protein n=1 Tax=Mycetomoellerius zeteki TaxID=64791 RepID=A0A151XJM5_9HYME|nr:hypothetical protein ALC60_00248 [Trachymyrmex zeteki]